MNYMGITRIFLLIQLVLIIEISEIYCREFVNYPAFISPQSTPWRNDFAAHNRRPTPRKDNFVYSAWTNWSECDYNCRQKRERFCWKREVCGTLRLVEEQLCSSDICQPLQLVSFTGDGAVGYGGLAIGGTSIEHAKNDDARDISIRILKSDSYSEPTTMSSKNHYQKKKFTAPTLPKIPPRKHKLPKKAKYSKPKTKLSDKLRKIKDKQSKFNNPNDHVEIFQKSVWDYPQSNYDFNFKKPQIITSRHHRERAVDRQRPDRPRRRRPRLPKYVTHDDIADLDNLPAFSAQNEEILIDISSADGMKNVRLPHSRR